MMHLSMLKKKTSSKEDSHGNSKPKQTISVRQKLLSSEVQELPEMIPRTCRVNFNDPNKLEKMDLTIIPDEGYWHGGWFRFRIDVPEGYNIVPPTVRCDTKIWHPNINEDGEVCLSLLRQNSLDGMGWSPVRKIKDVVSGLNSLFGDLLNFEDPLNVEAAEHYYRDKDAFIAKVRDYVQKYAKR